MLRQIATENTDEIDVETINEEIVRETINVDTVNVRRGINILLD